MTLHKQRTDLILYVLKWFILFVMMTVVAFSLVQIMPLSGDLHPFADSPLWVQYLDWLSRFFTGQWGVSKLNQLPVFVELMKRLPYSLAVAMGGVFVSGFGAFWLGYKASLGQKNLWYKLSQGLSIALDTVPFFILATILMYVIAVRFTVLRLVVGSPIPAVLLGICLVAIYQIGMLSGSVYDSFKKIQNKTFIKAYTLRGFFLEDVLLKYGTRPTLVRLFSEMSRQFSWVIGGAAIVELVFGIPGINSFLVESLREHDYLVAQPYLMLVTLWLLVVNAVFFLMIQGLERSLRRES